MLALNEVKQKLSSRDIIILDETFNGTLKIHTFICPLCKKPFQALAHMVLYDKKWRSCGCSSANSRHRMWKGCGDISGGYFNKLYKNAKKRKIEIDINIEYLWNLFIEQNRLCKLTNVPLYFSYRRRDYDQTASIDRIDSNKGYIRGNLQWIHKDVNYMKSDLTQTEFLNYCYLINNPHQEVKNIEGLTLLKKRSNFKGYKNITSYWYYKYEYNANLRKITWNLTKEQIWKIYEKQLGLCFYTKLPVFFRKDQSKENRPQNLVSLDRIDSNVEYNPDNVVICHSDINYMKRDLSVDKFYEYCKLILENNKEKI